LGAPGPGPPGPLDKTALGHEANIYEAEARCHEVEAEARYYEAEAE